MVGVDVTGLGYRLM